MTPAEAQALLTGNVEHELLLRIEFLAAENAMLRARIEGRVLLTQMEKEKLIRLARALGKKALAEVATIVKPETILRWAREQVAKKFTSEPTPRRQGRPKTSDELEALVVSMALENRGWGKTRICGELKKLGIETCRQTISNILRRNDIPPAPEREDGMSWADFIKTHKNIIAAGDFFTAEVLTSVGFVTFYVLFFMHLDTRKIEIAGITRNPTGAWMKQVARNITFDGAGFINGKNYLIIDRDTKFTAAFRSMIDEIGTEVLPLPPRSSNLNAFAERFVLSAKVELLSRLVITSEAGLRHALREFLAHYHGERPHQGIGNVVPFPANDEGKCAGQIVRHDRLGGLLKSYSRKAA